MEVPWYLYTEIGSHTHTSDAAAGKTTGHASGIDDHTHDDGTLGVDSHTESYALDLVGFQNQRQAGRSIS